MDGSVGHEQLQPPPPRPRRPDGATAPPPGMLYTSGYPTLFGSATFGAGAPSPSLFLAHPRETLGAGECDAAGFTADDRMLLKMVYHQQQAIQVQLSTLTTWMQHVSGLLSGLERHARAPPTPAAAAAPVSPAAEVAPPAPAAAPTPPPPSSTGPSHVAPSSAAAPSSACTPPADGVGSAVNRSVDSVGGMWDPSARRMDQQHPSLLRVSRAGSLVARRENPLLSSAPGSGIRRTASATSSTLDSSVDNTLMGSRGYAASGNTSGAPSASYSRTVPRSQPVLGRPQTAAASSTGSIARALAEREIPQFRHVDAARAPCTDPPAATSALLHRSGRPPGRAGAPTQPPTQGPAQATVPRALASASASVRPSPSPSAATPTAPSQPRAPQPGERASNPAPSGPVVGSGSGHGNGTHEPHSRLAGETLGQVDEEVDSDDGYGSYDSRQYMKSLGLL